MDNFSWPSGYKQRYGFLFLDRETLQPYGKKSSRWFEQIIANRGFEGEHK